MDVNNVKCVNCKHCVNFADGYYWCNIISDELELIEECIANDDNLGCDGYIDEFEEVYDKDSNVNPTA